MSVTYSECRRRKVSQLKYENDQYKICPSYRYGNEDDLVTLFGVMQAIVSVVIDADDELQSIHTDNTHFTFLRKGNILLVSVSQVPSETVIITTLQLK